MIPPSQVIYDRDGTVAENFCPEIPIGFSISADVDPEVPTAFPIDDETFKVHDHWLPLYQYYQELRSTLPDYTFLSRDDDFHIFSEERIYKYIMANTYVDHDNKIVIIAPWLCYGKNILGL